MNTSLKNLLAYVVSISSLCAGETLSSSSDGYDSDFSNHQSALQPQVDAAMKPPLSIKHGIPPFEFGIVIGAARTSPGIKQGILPFEFGIEIGAARTSPENLLTTLPRPLQVSLLKTYKTQELLERMRNHGDVERIVAENPEILKKREVFLSSLEELRDLSPVVFDANRDQIRVRIHFNLGGTDFEALTEQDFERIEKVTDFAPRPITTISYL